MIAMLVLWALGASEYAPAQQSYMQPFLLLEKPGTKKRMRYYVGDDIIFKLRGEKQIYQSILVGLSDSSIYIGQWTPVKLTEVEAIINRDKVPFFRGLSQKALFTIPVFFVFSAANNTFNTGRRPIIDPEVWTLSGVFGAIGLAGTLYRGRRYRLDNRWRIIVVHH